VAHRAVKARVVKTPPRKDPLPPFARAVAGGLELAIKVVPGASRTEIAGPLGNRLKVRIAAPPQGGKANRALVQVLSEWLGVSDVEIVAGHSSAEKTVRVFGLSAIREP
jgi:uncharacterized protein (TIGR00251 family)